MGKCKWIWISGIWAMRLCRRWQKYKKVNETVTIMRLIDNYIGNVGAAALAEALKVNRTITQLYLIGNQIGDAGAAAVAETLKVNGTVTELFLDGNQIGNAGAAASMKGLKLNSTLTELGSSQSQIDDKQQAELKSTLKEQPARARRLAEIRQRQRMLCFAGRGSTSMQMPELGPFVNRAVPRLVVCLPDS